MPEDETVIIREKEAKVAAEILGIGKIDFWKETDGLFQASPELVSRLIINLETFRPAFIYVTHEDEAHPDHREAASLVRRAIDHWPPAVEKPVVWMYEVWTPLQKMDHIVDITSYVDIKRKAILAYESQCAVLSFDEAILGLNRYHGEMHSWPGGDYAEVFKKMEIV